jgi:hypothetical protein
MRWSAVMSGMRWTMAVDAMMRSKGSEGKEAGSWAAATAIAGVRC